MSILARIGECLRQAPDPICAHALAREDGPALSLLADLGLVKPIATRVPKCSAHPCAYRGECEHEEVFETGGPGRAGVKARLLPTALSVAANPEALRARVLAMPLCADVLERVRQGPCSIFALNTWRLERCLEEIEQSGQVKERAFDRVALGRAVALLEELGLLRRSADGADLTLGE